MDVREFERLPAPIACSGCTVEAECAQHHLRPINVTEFIERLTGERLDDGDDVVPVSCVKCAGLDIGEATGLGD